ncbi:hypothetical protein ASC94_25985 [Massilia sp. Root418]|jgi:hypothetical protein|uniref:YciI family protein n=1 Tax=Massilia sp. Root418 TaxID=1736532 RepID=UPI0006F4E485|nr:YciI family protein [Massilia sp. Root418]KQW87942.1 hypothetical protein ASC94_25985 [Massilia sp. Root418]
MEYMILIYADEKLYSGMSEQQLGELMTSYGAYTQELIAAGVMRSGSELAPVHTATTVRVRDGKIACTDGPFAETKEQLGGYYLIDCANLDEAIKWAARCPGAKDGSMEVRPQVKTV